MSLTDDLNLESSAFDNGADEFKIGMGRKDKIHDSVGGQSLACLAK